MDDVKTLCVQIDDAILEYFNCLDNVIKIQAELNNCLKDGFFNMAKARYSMGAKAVSSLQYNTDEMEASIKVSPLIADEESGNPTIVFQNNEEVNQNGTKINSMLRKRILQNPPDDEKTKDEVMEKLSKLDISENNTDIEDNRKESSKSKSHNPLHWFGVLVPQSLRWSQHNFVKATELSVDLATAKAQLIHALYHFRQLQCEKSIILNSDASDLFLNVSSIQELPNDSQYKGDESLSEDVDLLSPEAMQETNDWLAN